MEPRQQGLAGGTEHLPVTPGSYEHGAQLETAPGATVERVGERQPEVGAVQAEVAQVAMPALPTPVISAPTGVTATTSSSSDVPDVAGDDDLIEKEWVDKAKKILLETKDDPYLREREISKLQIEYIRKRYGREIGDTGE